MHEMQNRIKENKKINEAKKIKKEELLSAKNFKER